ncbi:ABC transporter substrate-binding protein [Clostridium oryzae]|uniref:Lipoprotein LipO n=1 Tax=Clostridium oryzae TaxID=1450648 RepID=A0A1V4IZC0_9CLOT|nr:ABC transporter substrate-binding protein [Clostridium oryzae]OPJ65125.1 lipoprotein LipO precursor [Clostridium oryzae]
MKKFKIAGILLSVCLIGTVFAGCSKKKTEDTGKKMDKSPITLSFYSVDLTKDDDFNNPVAKEITKKTGVTLKMEHPTAGDTTNAIALLIAGGDYPDMIYAKGDLSKLVDAGAVIKLDDYFEKYGSNLKKLYGDQFSRLKYSPDDPSIYTVGAYGVHKSTWDSGGVMQLQNAVLKEEGYPQIKTANDYEKAIKTYLAKHPTIDGNKTIGISLLGSDWRWLITCGNPSGFALGMPDDGQWSVNDETGEATYKFMVPAMRDYYKWMNKLNHEGLLDPESFTQKQDTYLAKISSGRVLGLMDQTWDYQEATRNLIKDNKAERAYARLPVTLNSSYKDPELKYMGYTGGYGIAISHKCKNPKRAFQFLDWMASDEAQVLNNWGIKGKNYVVKNGKRIVPAAEMQKKTSDKDYSLETGVGQYVYPFPCQGDGVKDSTGNYYSTNSPENYIASYSSADKETLKAYGAKLWTDLMPSQKELGTSKHGQAYLYSVPSSSDLSLIQKKADDYTQKAITQAILTDPSKFDAAWDAIQAKLKSLGIEKANKEMTELTQKMMKLYGTK